MTPANTTENQDWGIEMKLFSLRKRTARHAARPAHRAVVVQISTQDRVIAALSGYTPEEWDALPALVKQDKRETVAWELRAAS